MLSDEVQLTFYQGVMLVLVVHEMRATYYKVNERFLVNNILFYIEKILQYDGNLLSYDHKISWNIPKSTKCVLQLIFHFWN